MFSKSDVVEQTFRAVVTRADGTVEDLGVIGYYHRNPLMRGGWKLVKASKALKRRMAPWFRAFKTAA